MKITEIFQPPFRSEGAFIYSANGVMALMAANCRNYPKEMMSRVVQLLNGEDTPKGGADIGVNDNEICVNGDPLLVVRGWDYLTGDNGLSLPQHKAIEVQRTFAVWIVDHLRGND
ncbi:hypothetical protein [uncultured Duncaniella sp.]|jgi:hypothetical protein|uniref:hypothetical protein n=1 Tax=uncultured Duncaniella sp. TaxID=2768039 RepID=UPI00265A40E8|nr:hypothetical protein [uncultured Duncaniella sp.]